MARLSRAAVSQVSKPVFIVANEARFQFDLSTGTGKKGKRRLSISARSQLPVCRISAADLRGQFVQQLELPLRRVVILAGIDLDPGLGIIEVATEFMGGEELCHQVFPV